MPGKPRLPVPGFLRLRELAEEAKRQDIALSLSGLKRQIELGQIQPDSYEQRVYKPSPLFRRDRLTDVSRFLFDKIPRPANLTAGLRSTLAKLKKKGDL